MKKKLLASVVAIALVACCVIGGTLAWLTDTTDPVVNTFTIGDIDITLAETTGTNYKVVPGTDITKNPKVTVEGGSEACYLFVKIEEANWNDGLGYAVADGWTKLADTDNVWYREVSANTADQEFYVLKDNEVTVSGDMTKTDVAAFEENAPTLTFTAYAIQSANTGSAVEAWAELNPTTAP